MRSLTALLAVLALAALVAGGGLAAAHLDDRATTRKQPARAAAPGQGLEPLSSSIQPEEAGAPTVAPPTRDSGHGKTVLASQELELPPTSRSRALGLPFRRGRLVNGVPLPSQGANHWTYDPVTDRSPNPKWRRYATDRTVARVLVAVARYRRNNPGAPVVGIGDLSRPHGGFFGSKYGALGHASHQNGLDVDILYPRKDRLLKVAERPRLVDQRLAQKLVDEFLRMGPQYVFVGPRLRRLHGPKGVVLPLAHHDDHLHVRFYP